MQKIGDDYDKGPMIKSLRSREIPLITRKWKERRKVKILDPKAKTASTSEITTEAIIKTAHKFRSSSPTSETFNLELLNATLLKVKKDKIVHEQQSTPA